MPKDEFDSQDPLELVGMVLPGDARQVEHMAETIVEEYVRMGWDERRLFTLFTNPMFMATHRIYQQKGEAYVKSLVHQTCAKYQIPTAEVNNA